MSEISVVVEGPGRHYRRNSAYLIAFNAIWAIGMGFAAFYVAVPAYLVGVHAPKTLIGFIQSGLTIFAFTQILSAYFLDVRHRKRYATLFFSLSSIAMLLAGLCCLVLPAGPTTNVWLFSLLTLAFICLILLGQPLLMELQTDNIPREIRGHFFGLQQAALGVVGLLVSGAGGMILSRAPFPTNYHICFAITGFFYLISCYCLAMVKDYIPPSRVAAGTAERAKSFRDAATLLDDRNYLALTLFFVCLQTAAAIGMAYIIPYAKERLGLTDGQVGQLMKVYFIAAIVSGLAAGRIADRFNYRVAAAVLAMGTLVGYALCLLSSSMTSVYIAYGLFCAFTNSTAWLILNLSVEARDDIKPSALYAIGTVVPIPAVLLCVTLSGRLIDSTGHYRTVFAVGMVLALFALIGFIFKSGKPKKFY